MPIRYYAQQWKRDWRNRAVCVELTGQEVVRTVAMLPYWDGYTGRPYGLPLKVMQLPAGTPFMLDGKFYDLLGGLPVAKVPDGGASY